MEFLIGYLVGSGASWDTVLVTLGIAFGVLVLIIALTRNDLS